MLVEARLVLGVHITSDARKARCGCSATKDNFSSGREHLKYISLLTNAARDECF